MQSCFSPRWPHRWRGPAFLTLASLAISIQAAPAGAEDLRMRVVDVGNGLCVVIRAPGGRSMLYDSGDKGGWCLKAIEELVPAGEPLDLVVISHSDSDHVGELPEILGARHAATVVYTGDAHLDETQAIRDEVAAIGTAAMAGTRVWRLADRALPDPDGDGARSFTLGEARVTLVAGWSDGDMTIGAGEKKLPKAEHNNALSLVARVEYAGRSVLLTRDTVGRFRGDPPATCAYAERIMVARAGAWPIGSDVLIGQHHGGDNATSNCFIRAVAPRYVVFSAGSKGYKHPTQAVADRLTSYGVRPANMFRTDRGDDEGPGEWQTGDIRGCVDQPGDDDVEVVLPADGSEPRLSYRQEAVVCPVRKASFYAARPRTARARSRR